VENLVVTTPGFLAGLVALAAVVLLVTIRMWLRRRPWSASALTILTLVLCVAATADFVNAHYEYAPQVRDVTDVALPGFEYHTLSATDVIRGMSRPRGGVVRVSLPASHDGFGVSHELVYVPKAYFTTRAPLPVIYLLHGTPGSAEDWFRAAHAADVGALLDARGEPAILVAPEMSRGWTDDSECVNGAALRAETHLLDVVIPTTQRMFRVRTDRDGRVIAGNSAGGFCALNLGLRHRDEFATIIDLSGFTRPTYDGGLARLFGPGPNLAAEVRANSPDLYGPSLPPGPATRIWFDVGSSDRQSLIEESELASEFPKDSGITARLTVRPGGHTYGVWRPALRDAAIWALENSEPSVV
jgi:enterochelin esterase-like enzyme